ncbi:hypothetical protein LTS15_006114 [Exophiala xenobiotica]|nr:hypothetical protein LTS15_006114 [Exophiala xenobiotica]
MANVSSPSSRQLPQLPSAVLYEIATHLINDLDDEDNHRITLSTLKSLRLTCRDVARMTNINRAMFKSINLHATEDKLQQLLLTGLGPIRPFVRQLNFFPSPYIPGLSREEFEGILRIHYSGFKFPSRCLPCRRLHDEHAEDVNCLPLSDREIVAQFMSYTKSADEDMDLLRDGILPDLWRKEILPLRNVSSIRLCSITRLRSTQPYIINDQCDMCDVMSSLMNSITGRNGDRLFEAVIRTLISTQLPVEELEIGCELENTFQPGWSDRSWRQLNLDKLKTLTINRVPILARCHPEAMHHDCATRICAAVIQKVQNTVQNITLSHGNGLHWSYWANFEWPPVSQLEQSPLRSVHLHGYYLDAGALADAILLSPRLDKLSLDRCQADDWKTFFNAIRRKPNSFDFVCFDMWSCVMVSWDFDIKDKDVAVVRPSEETPLQKDLYSYLTQGGEWTEFLEDVFPSP